MGNEEVDNMFTWVIKDFSSLQYEKIYSDAFVIGGCKWHLLAYPKGNKFNNCLSLYLVVDDSRALPCGWRRSAHFSLTVENQTTEKLSQRGERHNWFNQRNLGSGFTSMIPLTKLHSKDGGFLVNDELKIVVVVDVLEVIGKSDESEEYHEERNQPMKKVKLNDNNGLSIDLLNETPPVKESIDVNGFQVLPSQVESVKCIFERHPDIASKFRPKNRHLKSTYINVLLGLIKTLCQLPAELSDDDLDETSVAVSYVKNGGFKLDWLEKKLTELKAKKKKVETGKARLQQTEEELEKLNKKCLEMKVLLEKEYAEVSEANVPLSFDDVV